MNKSFLLVAFLIAGSFLFGATQETHAQQYIIVQNFVSFDSDARRVGGVAATYVTYGIYQYYDPGAFGQLFYLNPNQQIDQDGGFGRNDYYLGLPGWRADFITSDYRVNRDLCTESQHYLRRVYTPIPLQWSDPYQIAAKSPEYFEQNEHTINIADQFTDTVTPDQITLVAYGRVCIQTPTVQSVTFVTINSDVTGNPTSLGGGSRIFPDRQSPDDQTNRRTVRVRAQLAPSGGSPSYTQGASVYIKSFDVDDPSSDDLALDNTGSAGGDNRELPREGILSDGSTSCPANYAGMVCRRTDANGVATVIFTTTMQPGDNFVIAVSTDDNYLNGVTINGTELQDSSGNQIQTSSGRARRTNMLTVWRRLHIEVDSMGPLTQNFAIGTIPQTERIRAGEEVILNVTTPFGQPLEINRFENGRMVINYRSYRVVRNGQFDVTILGSGQFSTVSAGSSYTLYDDDDHNDDDGPYPVGDGTLDGDTEAEDIDETPQVFALMRDSDDTNCVDNDCNIFASAYIRPNYTWMQGGGYNQSNITFGENYTGTGEQLGAFLDNLPSFPRSDERNDFWVTHMFLAYQAYLPRDGDPAVEHTTGTGTLSGFSYAITALTIPHGATPPDGSRSCVSFLETTNDQDDYFTAFPDPDNPPVFRISTAPHEIGHQMGIDGDVPGYGIMSYGNEPLVFVPAHLHMLRSRITSPGLQ